MRRKFILYGVKCGASAGGVGLFAYVSWVSFALIIALVESFGSIYRGGAILLGLFYSYSFSSYFLALVPIGGLLGGLLAGWVLLVKWVWPFRRQNWLEQVLTNLLQPLLAAIPGVGSLLFYLHLSENPFWFEQWFSWGLQNLVTTTCFIICLAITGLGEYLFWSFSLEQKASSFEGIDHDDDL